MHVSPVYLLFFDRFRRCAAHDHIRAGRALMLMKVMITRGLGQFRNVHCSAHIHIHAPQPNPTQLYNKHAHKGYV